MGGTPWACNRSLYMRVICHVQKGSRHSLLLSLRINENGQMCYWHTLYYIWSNYTRGDFVHSSGKMRRWIYILYLTSSRHIRTKSREKKKTNQIRKSSLNDCSASWYSHLYNIIDSPRTQVMFHWLVLFCWIILIIIFFLSLIDDLKRGRKKNMKQVQSRKKKIDEQLCDVC